MREITDVHDERLADYVSLREAQLRLSYEAEHGLFIAEGDKVIRRAVAAGYRPRSFFLAQRWVDSLSDVIADAPEAPCYVADEDLIEDVTGFHVHRGALASMLRKPLPTMGDVIADAARVVVLEDLVDHTNVGAVFRNAAAMGWDAVLLSPRCSDPLYRRAIKVSMGAVFAIPYARVENWFATPAELRKAGITTVALTPAEDSLDIDAIVVPDRCALLVGTEGDGLSGRWMIDADRRVHIPMAAGIDSLNVAAAAAVACYALRSVGG